MKSFLLFVITLLLFCQPWAEARQVRVLSDKVEFIGKVNTKQRKSLILQNDSDQVKEYFLKFTQGNIGSSQSMKVCLDNSCYNPIKEPHRVRIKLKPGEIFTDLYIEFDLGIIATRGTFDLHFFNTENARDSFIIEGVYNVEAGSDESFIHKDFELGGVYPNPTNRVAQLDYKIKNPSVNARVVVTSFIGNPIYDFRLDPMQYSLEINVTDLNPGVYFYTIIVDNKNIVTKKLFVNK
ncbi:MAG: T9SS type A sorting domain-containing protein [Lunatimonas sp.]|uniref:T9SS type A sorting domain-containing protein n=1 Tax=Lunatimonas sp. TaxID=2060141 RepID=UPI00263AE3B0|nr:T9SS type A sorting domain-containing protein [Lunatimonas sp.]MCC5935962.1 T9SS type A sorting domain-containing protein [Lunatimonas sp.]